MKWRDMKRPSASRRTFLQSGIALAASSALPGFRVMRSAHAATGVPRTLIVIHLAGGNDTLNTVVPYTNPDYYAARKLLAVPAAQVLPLNAQQGLHPALWPGFPPAWDGPSTPKLREPDGPVRHGVCARLEPQPNRALYDEEAQGHELEAPVPEKSGDRRTRHDDKHWKRGSDATTPKGDGRLSPGAQTGCVHVFANDLASNRRQFADID